MLVALPLLCFLFVFALLRCWRPTDTDIRATLLSASVVWAVLLVVITEFLSLPSAMSRTTLACGWTLTTLVAGLLVALHVRRSERLTGWTLARPSLAAMAMALPIAVVLFGTGLSALAGWPSQWDSMVYHMSRVDHWIQNGGVSFYPTHIVRQLHSPPWAEFAILHLTILSGDERCANSVQWFSMLGSLAGVSLIAQHLAATPRGQIFSALFCSTLPMGILQASGTQNDYVSAFWLVCLTEALLSPPTAWRTFRVGASLGLATLSKGTSLVFAPSILIALWSSASWWARIRHGALVVLIALALNVSHFARSFEIFGSPLGPSLRGPAPEDLVNEALSPAILASNLVRNLSLHVGTPFPIVNTAFERAIERGHAWFGMDVNDPRSTRLYSLSHFDIVGTSTDPDRTGNPLHLALILAAVAVIAVGGGRRLSSGLGRYILALVLAVVLFSLLLKWQPWHSRLHLPLFVLASPLVGVASDRFGRLSLAVAAVLMTVFAMRPLTVNRLAPLVGPHTVLNTPRIHQSFQSFGNQPSQRELGYVGAAEFLRSRKCADVGLLLGWDDWEHPLWVLLANGRGRIEHVAVTNRSARLEGRRPAFAPCGIVVAVDTVAEAVELDGRSYCISWSGPVLKVFLSGECPGHRSSVSPALNVLISRAAILDPTSPPPWRRRRFDDRGGPSANRGCNTEARSARPGGAAREGRRPARQPPEGDQVRLTQLRPRTPSRSGRAEGGLRRRTAPG
jgi:hypothetical protein